MVQQVDGQVPGRGAELAVAAQQRQDVDKESAALQEWGVGSEGGQLQLLEDRQDRRGGSGLPPESLGCPRRARHGGPPAGW